MLERPNGPSRAPRFAVRAKPHVEQAFRLVDGLGKGVSGVLLVETGARDLAVHTPERALGGEHILAEQLEDAVGSDILRECLAALRDLVDHLGALGVHREASGSGDQEGLGTQAVEVCLASVVAPVGEQDPTRVSKGFRIYGGGGLP